jgi:N utilization substance protein A
LSPAIITRIVVDEAEGLLEVIVPDDQLTNAIGRKGQNVKLAAKLLGWKIDIYTETRYNEANAIGHSLEQLASVAEVPLDSFVAAGLTTFDAIGGASDEELLQIAGITPEKIANVRAAINFLRPAEDREPAAPDAEDGDSAAPDAENRNAEDDDGKAAGE